MARPRTVQAVSVGLAMSLAAGAGWAGAVIVQERVVGVEVQLETLQSAPEPEVITVPLGTQDNPLDINAEVALGDFTVTISEQTEISTKEVVSSRGIRRAPIDGWEYVTTRTAISYNGAGTARPFEYLEVAFLGSDGQEYYDSCSLTSDTWYDSLGMKKGGHAVTKQICTGVPRDVVEGGSWVLKSVRVDTPEAYYFKAVS